MNQLRFSVAAGSGRRGAGLGNEVIAWCKSYLAAEALDLELLRPRWLLNQYKIPRAMGWSCGPMLGQQIASRPLPTLRVDERLYLSAGVTDYGDAMLALARSGAFEGRHIVLQHEGMWGGYQAIRGARAFLWQQILSAPHVPRLLRAIDGGSGLPVVGVHVRLGDFDATPPGPGQFNAALPLDWYRAAMRSLSDAMDGKVRFIICSNARKSDLAPLLEVPSADVIRGEGNSAAIQELAVLAASDALICSVSSFSMLAAHLSGKPFVWFRPQLTRGAGGLSIWGHEPAQQDPESPTSRHTRALEYSEPGRGRAWQEGDRWDATLLEHLAAVGGMRQERSDLLYYGVVPDPGAAI